jgi:hypothetical protein
MRLRKHRIEEGLKGALCNTGLPATTRLAACTELTEQHSAAGKSTCRHTHPAEAFQNDGWHETLAERADEETLQRQWGARMCTLASFTLVSASQNTHCVLLMNIFTSDADVLNVLNCRFTMQCHAE